MTKTPVDIQGEVGSVSLSSTIDDGSVVANVSFSLEYTNPAIIPYIATQNGSQTIAPRVRNLTSTGCDIFMEEPDNEGHNGETVFYLVMESGTYNVDGTLIEAGVHNTSTTRSNTNGSTFGDSISFSQSFSSAPVLLHGGPQTYNNGEFVVTQANSITASGFNLSQEIMGTNSSTTTEDIGWIAISPSTGTIGEDPFDAGAASDGSADGYEDTTHNISFSQSFSSAPAIIVAGQTMNGSDGFLTVGTGIPSTSSHSVYAMEDQITDTERAHADETFGWFAISEGVLGE